MRELYVKKEQITDLIDRYRIQTSALSSVALQFREFKDNLIRANSSYYDYLSMGVLEYDAKGLSDYDALDYFRSISKETDSLHNMLDTINALLERYQDEFDNLNADMNKIIQHARKIRDSGFFESEYLKKYSNRDEIKRLKDEFDKKNSELRPLYTLESGVDYEEVADD